MLTQRLIRAAYGEGGEPANVTEMLHLAGEDRKALEEARNAVAGRLHDRPDDYQATAALRTLNRTIAELGWVDPYDWKVRWAQHRKP